MTPPAENTLDPRSNRRALVILALGALFGITAGLVAGRLGEAAHPVALPPGAIALVNGTPVPKAEYSRALEMVAGDRREPPSPADRARVLRRLVDEELLAQYAVASGLTSSDRGVRDAILGSMVESAVADRASRAPREDELHSLYDETLGRESSLNAQPPPFNAVRAELENAWTERARAEALRSYVADLRQRAHIELAPTATP